MESKFKIHYLSSMYAFELYDSKGREVFTLEAAVEAAKDKYPDEAWEVYNGSEAYLYQPEGETDHVD
jgi:hypothetical protein